MRQTKQLLFSLLLIFLVILAGYNFLSEFESHDITLFSNSLISFLQNLAAIGLILLVFQHLYQPEKPVVPSPSKVSYSGWLFFFTFISICVLITVMVNPRGLYGVRIFPQLANALKEEKIQYFNALNYEPDLVILGSSRSLTISPRYIKNTLGLSAYNFGFSGVSTNELSLLGDLIFSNRNQNPPSVVLFDISPSTMTELEENNLADIPVEFVPYMSFRKATNYILDRYLELFNIHQFSEAVYVLQYIREVHTPQTYWDVEPDGYSHYFPPDTLTEAIERQLKERQNKQPCKNFDENGDAVIQKYVSLAKQKNFSIIFYYSPVHPTFKQGYMDNSSKYDWCSTVFFDLMHKLENKNPFVFFVDVNDPNTASLAIDNSGFYDGFHITPANAEKLIDYLAPTIQQAYQFSKASREKQP